MHIKKGAIICGNPCRRLLYSRISHFYPYILEYYFLPKVPQNTLLPFPLLFYIPALTNVRLIIKYKMDCKCWRHFLKICTYIRKIFWTTLPPSILKVFWSTSALLLKKTFLEIFILLLGAHCVNGWGHTDVRDKTP